MKGKSIYYVTGATLSYFVRETFSEQDGGAGLSAGSWLSVDAKYYKGSGSLDSVPIVSVRGFWLDVPDKDIAAAAADIARGAVPLKLFDTLTDLGLDDGPLRHVTTSSGVAR